MNPKHSANGSSLIVDSDKMENGNQASKLLNLHPYQMDSNKYILLTIDVEVWFQV